MGARVGACGCGSLGSAGEPSGCGLVWLQGCKSRAGPPWGAVQWRGRAQAGSGDGRWIYFFSPGLGKGSEALWFQAQDPDTASFVSRPLSMLLCSCEWGGSLAGCRLSWGVLAAESPPTPTPRPGRLRRPRSRRPSLGLWSQADVRHVVTGSRSSSPHLRGSRHVCFQVKAPEVGWGLPSRSEWVRLLRGKLLSPGGSRPRGRLLEPGQILSSPGRPLRGEAGPPENPVALGEPAGEGAGSTWWQFGSVAEWSVVGRRRGGWVGREGTGGAAGQGRGPCRTRGCG